MWVWVVCVVVLYEVLISGERVIKGSGLDSVQLEDWKIFVVYFLYFFFYEHVLEITFLFVHLPSMF